MEQYDLIALKNVQKLLVTACPLLFMMVNTPERILD